LTEAQATAGFRNAGWTMAALPSDTRIGVHPLATHDGAAVTGLLYAADRSKTVLCIMHPREFMASHYLIPALVSAGFAVWTQTSRSVGQDLRLEHELTLLDVAAGQCFLREQGFRRIVLVGNSGGASLFGFYNQQALRAPEGRIQRTPGGRPVQLSTATMPAPDGIVLVSPHPGQGQILLRCIDPAVIEETDPLRSDPRLDFLSPDNGYHPGPGGSCFPTEFIERHVGAQRDRVVRLDAIARDLIAERMTARRRAQDSGAIADRRAGAFSQVMTVWRTDADLRCWDLSLDPSDRKLGSVWGSDPFVTNYGVPGFGRFCTPEAWLSTWSGLTSNANLLQTAASFEQPCLQIEYSGDNSVFPGDGDAVFKSIRTRDKAREGFRGDHHGRSLGPKEPPGRDSAAAAIVQWTRDRFS
jgi:hypothetical protein